MAAPPPRRTRRSSAEVRSLILDAAREQFAADGYAGATTKEIARRADVAEALLFRAFESKENLFSVAVLQPFDQFLERYTERWMTAPVLEGAPEELLRQFVEELYALVRDNRRLFAAMAAGDVRHGAQPAFARLERMGEHMAVAHGVRADSHVAVRVATITVVATALFEEDLFAGATERRRIVDELIRMLIGATMYRPEDAARSSPR